jgi:hypothetical protein
VFDLVGAGLIPARPLDANGREVRLGDWVRVIQAPLSIIGMPADSLDAFSRAVGHTFQVESVQRNGDLELDTGKKIGCGWIWLEACCCVVTRRPAKRSRHFQAIIDQTLEHDKKRGRPEYRVQP